MRRARRIEQLLSISLAVLLLATGLGLTTAAADGVPSDTRQPGEAATSATRPACSQPIRLVQELRLTPDSPGEIGVRLRYTVPTGVEALRSRPPAGATVQETRGFVRAEPDEYAWDRSTPTPSLTYRLPANRTVDATGPIAGRGDFAFVDAGPWALVEVPPTATSWTRTAAGPVTVTKEVTTAGEGAAGDAIAYLGAHREARRTAHGQTFRLVVPASATLAPAEADLFDSLAAAADALQVGDRDAEVFMVAAPTGRVEWGVRGLQAGSASFWVRDLERLDTADNVWLHEYVHTRQAHELGPDARWFTEASASYYAALFTLEQGRIGFEAFHGRLALGAERPGAEAVLADPATWDGVAPYLKGALVAGELDRQLRLTSDRSGSLQDVVSRLNDRSGVVTGAGLEEAVRAVGGGVVADPARRYTTTSVVPRMWDRPEHDRAFAVLPARLGYTLVPTDGVRVSGPYRNGTLDGNHHQLAVDETLTFTVDVRNVGGTVGAFDARLVVDGAVGDRATGRLGPGENSTVTLSQRFTAPGVVALTVGGRRLTVTVHRPARPIVDGLRATPDRGPAGLEVRAVATVSNPRGYPATDDVSLLVDGVPVHTRSLGLAPCETRAVTFELTLDEPGEHELRVGTQTAVVRVGLRTTPTATPEPVAGQADGFGFTVAILALVLLAIVRSRRR